MADAQPIKSVEEYIREASQKTGDARSGIVLGIRMALAGLKELGFEVAAQSPHSLITVVETDRCLPDAVGLVTGCRLGNRTLKFRNWGKMAATFVDRTTNRAVRVAVRESANLVAQIRFPARDKEQILRKAYTALPDEELFTKQRGYVALAPEDMPNCNTERVICSNCGEGIGFSRQVMQGSVVLCRSCTGEGYFILG